MNPALRRSKLPPPLGKGNGMGHKRLPSVEGPQALHAHAVSRSMGTEGHGRASDREHEPLPLPQAPEEPVRRRALQLGSSPCGEDLARNEEAQPQSARGMWQEQRPSSTQAASRHGPPGHDRSRSHEQPLGNGQPAWRGGRDQRQQGPSPPQGAPPRETHNR